MIKYSKNLPADERRAVTVQVVVELAAERNPSDITTAAIAKRMGLTQGALFRHFPTKEAILESVTTWIANRLLTKIDEAATQASTPMAAIEAMFMAHIKFVSEHPGVPRILFGELQRPGDTLPKKMVQTLLRQYKERLQRLLDAGISAEELNPNLDISAAAALFIGSIQGLVMQTLISGDTAHIVKAGPGVFAIYCRGIGRTV
ncbi:TetR/AcrR family transcriptional regulator [Glaciecola sp. SC05]|uniref:TetR/AcrR family transcriptional regulator n=1 Tax=Glaciecola sp. SC05 TaxID=1987355 RepID=UPI003526D7F8